MKFSIEFKYLLFFKLSNRHKKLNHVSLSDVAQFNIKEPDDFPVVYKVTDRESLYKNAKSHNEFTPKQYMGFTLVTEEIRKFKNKLFRPLRFTTGAAVSTAFIKPDDFLDERVWRLRELLDRTNWSEANKINSVENPAGFIDSDSCVHVGNSKKALLIAARKWFNQFLIFDNKVWEEIDPPCYTYNTFGLGHNHGGTAIFINYLNVNKIHGSQRKFYAKPEDREKFIQKVLKVAKNRCDTKDYKSIENLDLNIEIIHNS
jgi:hypothetical protein